MRPLSKATLILIAAAAVFVSTATTLSAASLRSIRSKVNRKEYEEAERSLREEIPSMRGRDLDRGRILLAGLRRDLSGAEKILDEVISTGDSREALVARVELAKIRYSTGDYHTAVRLLEGIRAEGRGGIKYEAVYFRALARKQIGDLEGAGRDFAGIDRGDYLHWSYIALAEIDIRSGRIEEAVGRYETIAADHSSPVAGFRLGECYEMTGEGEKARRTYQNVARNFPRSPEAPKAREKMEILSRYSRMGGGEEGESPSRESAVTADGSPGYTLQFGAFSNRENAHAFISDLDSMIDGLHIEVAESGGSVWYRVRAGRYASREEAEEAALRVMERTGYSSKVLPVE